MPAKQLTILVLPINAAGHVNACAGTTRPLLSRGHRVIFLLEEAYKNHVAQLGFEEHIFKLKVEENCSQADAIPGEDWAKGLLEQSVLGQSTPEEKWTRLLHLFVESKEAQSVAKQMNEQSKRAIELYKPDLIVTDTVYLLPVVSHCGIPWIHNMSIAPQIYVTEDNIPPGCSGLPSYASRDEAWHRLKKLHHRFLFSKSYNDFIETLGYPRFPKDQLLPNDGSLLVVYGYPEELTYPEISAKPWFNLEVFNRNELQETVDLKSFVGEKFCNDTLNGRWSGRWVYVSLGTLGSYDLQLMKRLLEALSETDHKFIVSKGPRHSEFGLPANCFGARYLPQTQLVPLMDLIITHGGNNTVTETFAQGKPMLVFPLFGDQFDNAQRIQETGHGIRLEPYSFTRDQLVSAIDKLLANEQLKKTMAKASARILASNKHEQLADLIEAKLSAAS